jgi:spermidine synthase
VLGRAPLPGLARPLSLTVFLIATCGLVYELLAGALSSYLLGDTVLWFSLIIGTYLSAMGVGSWLSRYIDRDVAVRFVEIELLVALVGGLQSPILFAGFAFSPAFRPLLLGLVFLIGLGVGVEIPLLMRILDREEKLKDLVARVLFFDYLGALAASVVFPLLLVPRLGLLRTSLAVGLINAVVGWWSAGLLEMHPAQRFRLRLQAAMVMGVLLVGLLGATAYERYIESRLFADPVVMSVQSSYQRLTLTRRGDDTRLYIDGALQFSSVDEYRYHEALVHPPMMSAAQRGQVLILGGGDGRAAREVLRYPELQGLTLVDLDPEMTRLFRQHPDLVSLNGGSLSDPRVRVENQDAFQWIRGSAGAARYDAIIIDFPDPNNYALGKLYSRTFFGWVRQRLSEGGALSIQSASPWWSPEAWSCIVQTLKSAGFSVRPYHAHVPSFGEWGFVLAWVGGEQSWRRELLPGMRFLDMPTLDRLFDFPPDLAPREAPVNRLDNQILVQLYSADWEKVRSP